jgi:hypothetical protein
MFWDVASYCLVRINQITRRLISEGSNIHSSHVMWVPCHHGMARPQVADGGDAVQILNKQSRTADNRLSSGLGVGRGANNSSP